ncbi:flagellar P-ring protein precursor FlgI [Roseibium hamelinense]|uniref:Flagellar P-ring protein n=1 Tax=Roseibium hamelinense TaxID=150831 RepID=A0A562TJG9_9HYPH|nr:flagellar basal body P-ring protein FlgI [Roseibium hamelinense]MTI45925.1 flagellar basal body P-ring protein FlgI [Roseibium hamelinense]TWI92890.1 flagellar P-ring protein precursor FlgI [Roseibium hamelinense]
MRFLLACFICIGLVFPAQSMVRIKDIASLQGVRDNQLVGYGLVIGLKGSGDSLRNSPFTEQSLQSMLDSLGVNVRGARLRTRNVAAVVVTAELPPYISKGSKIDVSVASLGDATSLAGGTLVATPLLGADGQIYAVGQGPVAVSGFQEQGAAETLSQGIPTAGRVANGALVERDLPAEFANIPSLVFELSNPDFRTAVRVADAINRYTRERYGVYTAREQDLRSVKLTPPPNVSLPRFIAEVEALRVRPDQTAKVVIDERTGTVVIGRDVQISTVAITHGNLTVRITEAPEVSQPSPFSPNGETVVVPRTFVDAQETGGQLAFVGGTDLPTLVRGLNRIGLRPTGIIAILQAIKSAGALQAELVVQ